eukprot:TRINITY_DN39161_c0_g1_i1.p1 TRINITY_DN39161_c0_g1~~TRINITY_DN39161_c0_g1_i1.p1  ORF type:complete len:246 (-),score=19.77 TRINITY_DN39161_c0_g1_i1:124-861(-)
MPATALPCREIPNDQASINNTAQGAYTKMASSPLPLTSLNHVSIHCADVDASVRFYCDVMGFIPVRRPHCLNFNGAWLFNHGIGLHLLGLDADPQAPKLQVPKEINPMSDHFSFQCEDIEAVEQGLSARGISYLRQVVEEGGIMVDQLFFHDPDGHMIEVCTCDLLPIVPLNAPSSALPACMARSFERFVEENNGKCPKGRGEVESVSTSGSEGGEESLDEEGNGEDRKGGEGKSHALRGKEYAG